MAGAWCVQIQGLEEERDMLQARVEKLERQLGNASDANQSLKRENDDLKQRLGIEVRMIAQPSKP